MKSLHRFTSASLIAICLFVAACTSWERSAFQTLSASKAVIDTAQADYESGTIPKTPQSYAAINAAKQLQTDAVNAMIVYENYKAQKASSGDLAAQQQVVSSILVKLPQLIAQIKALYAAKGGTQ